MEPREWRFAATMSVAHGIQHFFRRLLPPLIPVWGVAFGYPLWKLGLLLGVSGFGSAIGQAPLGVLSDRHDRRHILSVGMGLIGVSYVVFAAAPRLALGIGGTVAGYAVDDQFLVMLGSLFIAGIGANGVHVFIPEFVTSVYGYSFTLFGFRVTPASTASFYYSALLLTAGFVQLGTGELVDRYDGRVVILAFVAVATPVLAVLAAVELSPVALFLVLLVFGAAMWGMAPARDALISEITPEAREGRTFGYLWTGITLVSSVSPVIIGYIGSVAGLRQAFALLAIALAVSAIPIVLLFSDRVYLSPERWREGSAAD